MQRTFFKIALCLLFVGACVTAKRMLLTGSLNPVKRQLTQHRAVYFVGSSRVRYGINPEEIHGLITQNHRIYNVGAGSCTFLHNHAILSYLMHQRDSNTYVVEFSVIRNEMPPATLTRLESLGILYADIYRNLSFNEAEHIYNSLWVALQFRNLFDVYRYKGMSVLNAYVRGEIDTCSKTNSLLTPEDLHAEKGLKYTAHITLINELLKQARATHSRIYFFMPFVSVNKAEYNETRHVFKSLPDSVRIDYPEAFLHEIANPKFLHDNNHHNLKGAQRITAFFNSRLLDLY